MIGTEALPSDLLGTCAPYMPELFIKFVRRERDDVIGLPGFLFTTIRVETKLTHLAVLREQIFKHTLSYFIKFFSLDGRMTEVKVIVEFFLKSLLVAISE